MRTGNPLPSSPSGLDDDREREVLALAAQTSRMIAVAQALVSSQRHVDVDGLQQHVGLLCAKALDLPPMQTGFAKIELKRLAAGLAALHATMREAAA